MMVKYQKGGSMSLTFNDLPDHATMVRNFCGVWATASERDMKNGSEWYDNTLALCEVVRKNWPQYSIEQIVGAYAVISPSLDKEKNDEAIFLLTLFHAAGWPVENWPKVGTYGMPNRIKAKRCLDGDLSAVRGPKVTKFYNNILGVETDVTVDRWTARVALNDPKLPENKVAISSKRVNSAIANACVEAAAIMGVPARVMQSVTWESFRNTYYAVTGPNGGRHRRREQLQDDAQYEADRREVLIGA